jgi:hypothetical protein
MLVAGQASAYSGYLSGTIGLWLKSGNYCDAAVQDCTASLYPRSEFDTVQPFRNGQVEVTQGSATIGQGVTDDNGNFVMYWNTGNLSTQASVTFTARHKDSRFFFTNTSGQFLANVTGGFTLTNGTTQASPQNIGYWYAGSSASPTWYLNTFWQAEMQWRLSFALVGALDSVYTNVEVRGVAQNMPDFLGQCNTSCARGSEKKIQLDSLTSALSPQHRMMHEAGHVVSYQLKPNHGGYSQYCWPNATGSCTWSQGSAEWGSAAFEEGFATMMADTTLWNPDAVAPTSCLSSGRCSVNVNTNIETTHYPYATNNCSLSATSPEARWPISVQRFLWDVYDSHNDCDGDTIQEGWDAYWRLYAVMQTYPNGVDDHQIDEVWSSTSYTTIDDLDGRGATDYNHHYINDNGVDTNILWIDNCIPN